MTVIRENILVSQTARDGFLNGLVQLDTTMSGVTFADLENFISSSGVPINFEGVDQEFSIYDLFVFWHVVAMRWLYQVGNAAHSGPVFLPWHRLYLLRLEQAIQDALGDPDFGLPYWDWAADGELPDADQWRADLWSADYLGEPRGPVMTGACGNMRVRLYQMSPGQLRSVPPRRLQRIAGLNGDAPNLPDKDAEAFVSGLTEYDQSPWGTEPWLTTFRNAVEGWVAAPQMHNRVHVWIGGDMSPATSPNDPAFFLNHCYTDRLWERWMNNNGRNYAPGANAGPAGHRLNDPLLAVIGDSMTPAQVLDPTDWYVYDSLLVG